MKGIYFGHYKETNRNDKSLYMMEYMSQIPYTTCHPLKTWLNILNQIITKEAIVFKLGKIRTIQSTEVNLNTKKYWKKFHEQR